MTSLRYELTGPESAPVVVLSSALGTSYELWDAQVSDLAHSFNVLRYDHRGHGGSETPPGPYTVDELTTDVVRLLDDLGLDRVSFCGVSLGGAVGMQLAAAFPGRVDRLVLACTSARFGTAASWEERARVVREHGTGAIADALVERWFTPDAPAAEVARCRAMLAETPAEGYAGCCDALMHWDFRERLAEVHASTLVICGAEDPSTPVAHAEVIAAGTGAALLVLDGAAHLANVERPEAFNAAVLEHLLTPTEEVAT